MESERFPPIMLPRRLTYSTAKKLAAEHFATSLGAVAVTFDWTMVRYATLAETVSLLNWSARLRKLHKTVVWQFRDPSVTADDEGVRFAAALAERPEVVDEVGHELDEIRTELHARSLFRGLRLDRLKKLRQRLTSQAGLNWFDAIADTLDAADVLGYLDRYQALERAAGIGIDLVPDYRLVGMTKMGKAAETATISLNSILSVIDVDKAVGQLNDAAALSTMLGKYARLDVARRGGLANIVIRELGNNIEHHADASAGWLCSRAVERERLTDDDPVDRIFAAHGTGYLELTVCDNGVGLTNRLQEVLLSDNRTMTRKRYHGARTGTPTAVELIDYAFDRLSSSRHRRDLLADERDEAAGVASGLYWIWNLVRGHGGIIGVRTLGISAWYDLMEPVDDDDPPLPTDDAFPCEGTLIRICFPLAGGSRDRETLTHARALRAKKARRSKAEWKFHHVPVGDLSRVTASLPLLDESEEPSLTAQQDRLLAKLHERHDAIASGDVLILDLTGMRRQWDKTTAIPLSRFFVQTNYTAPAGRSAAVLWNVPQTSIEVFEQAVETVAHFRKTRDLSRFAFMVSERGEIRLFCGWRDAEQMFARFTRDAQELTLQQLGIETLAPDDQTRFIAGVRENTHLFDYKEATDRNQSIVALRPWTALLRSAIWSSNSEWFSAALDKPLEQGGLLLRKTPGYGYYRLPSTDLLSRDFYHFRGFFSNQQAFARISWSMFQVISRVTRKVPDFIIAVSRPAGALARSIAQEFASAASDGVPELLLADHIDHLRSLRRDHNLTGKRAVVVMTAISTGTQAASIGAVFTGDDIEWLGTFVCLDVRGLPVVGADEMDLEMVVERTEAVLTGPVYPLARRNVEKLRFDDAKSEPITSIDPINVCPVQLSPSEVSAAIGRPIFDFIGDAQALLLGHVDSGHYHHYVYFVDLEALLRQPDGLLDYIVRHVVTTMYGEYDADRTVILFPPPSSSSAALIASEVQQYMGARYEFALYRDTFAGEWRFSPFALHGLPLDEATVIIVDDGSNTGETLLGLIHAATIGEPSRIRAFVGLERLPPQKARLFRGLRSVAECNDVRIWTAAQLSIPVYSPRDCPICRLRRDLAHLHDNARLLKTLAKETSERLATQRSNDDRPRFLWRHSDPLAAAKLREELEMCEYNAEADQRLDRRLREIISERSFASLLDVAFVLCAEPDLIRSRAVARRYEELLAISPEAIHNCAERSQAATIACLAYYITTRIDVGRVENSAQRVIDGVISALLDRSDSSPRLMGQIVCIIAADAISTDVILSDAQTPVAWLTRLLAGRQASSSATASLTDSFAALYAREALTILNREPVLALVPDPLTHESLIDLITLVASKIYRHSSKTSESHVSKLLGATRVTAEWRHDEIATHAQALLCTIDQFEELRGRLFAADRESLKGKGETFGVLPDWYTPQIDTSVRRIADALRALGEMLNALRVDAELRNRARLEAVKVANEFERFTRATDLAFDGLFPRPFRVMDLEREKFVRKYPTIGAKVHIDPQIDRKDTVYFPVILLERFFDAAFENLVTAAFRGVRDDELQRATVNVVLSEVRDTPATPRQITVKIIDNGPLFPASERAELPDTAVRRGNRALSDVTALAPFFLGGIDRRSNDTQTTITLTMRAYKKADSLPWGEPS